MRERERANHITLSTPMSLYNMHILLIQIFMCKLQLKKKKKNTKQKKNMGREILWKHH